MLGEASWCLSLTVSPKPQGDAPDYQSMGRMLDP